MWELPKIVPKGEEIQCPKCPSLWRNPDNLAVHLVVAHLADIEAQAAAGRDLAEIILKTTGPTGLCLPTLAELAEFGRLARKVLGQEGEPCEK